MQTCRRTELLQMLGMTTIGSHSHVGSQALGEDRHTALLTCSRGIFPIGLQNRLSTHEFSYASAGVYDTFPSWCPRCDSPVGSNLDSLWATQVFSMNQFAFSQFCMMLAHTEKGRLSWLKQHNFCHFPIYFNQTWR